MIRVLSLHGEDGAGSVMSGVDPGLFLGVVAHSFFFFTFFLQNTSCIRKPPGHLEGGGGGGGVRTPCTLPLDPPLPVLRI